MQSALDVTPSPTVNPASLTAYIALLRLPSQLGAVDSGADATVGVRQRAAVTGRLALQGLGPRMSVSHANRLAELASQDVDVDRSGLADAQRTYEFVDALPVEQAYSLDFRNGALATTVVFRSL